MFILVQENALNVFKKGGISKTKSCTQGYKDTETAKLEQS